MQRNMEFCRHQHHSHDFIQTTKTTSIHLDVIQRLGLQELLEHDAILTVLASGDFDVVLAKGGADIGVAEDVVGGGGFFDEPGLELFEMLHVLDCFWD